MNIVRRSDRPRIVQLGLLALLLCVSISGCGRSMTEVSGTVRYNGKPLPSGTIQFLGADGVPHSGKIQPDGTYSVQVPTGTAKIIVSCVDESRLNKFTAQSTANRGRTAPPSSPAEKFSLIPTRYADWDSSGLMVNVTHGKTVHDIDLTSH